MPMRPSLIAALLACSSLSLPVLSTPILAPNRLAAQGGTGTYDGTPRSGYSAATLAMFTANRGKSISAGYSRPEYGYFGRTGTLTASNADEKVAMIFHMVSHPVTDTPIFTDQDQSLLFSAIGAAADGVAGGCSYVDVYCESDTPVRVANQTAGDIGFWGGMTRKGCGYKALLPAANLQVGESVDVYAFAKASLPGVADRVIGPFRFFRKAAYDRVISLNANAATDVAGVEYRDIRTLLNYLASGTIGGHVLVRCNSDITVDFTTPFTGNSLKTANWRGQVVIDANGRNCVVANSTFTAVQCNFSSLVWRGWKWDLANVSTFQTTTSSPFHHQMILDQCEITSSRGKLELPGTYGPDCKAKRNVQCFNGAPVALLRCWMHDCYAGDLYLMTAVGCLLENMCHDALNCFGVTGTVAGSVYGAPVTAFCNELRSVSGADMRIPLLAFALSYTGAGTATYDLKAQSSDSNAGVGGIPVAVTNVVTLAYSGAAGDVATFDITGAHGGYVPSDPRTVTLKVNGAAVKSFASSDATLTTMQKFVDAVNAFGGGWSATLVGPASYAFNKIGVAGTLAGAAAGQAVGTVLTYQNPRTLVLKVNGVPVKSFACTSDVGSNSAAGSYYIDDEYITTYKMTLAGGVVVPPGTHFTGAIRAINDWAAATGSPWSAVASNAGGLRMRFSEITVSPARVVGSADGALFSDIPVAEGVFTGLDAHVDIGQIGQANHENCLLAHTYSYECLTQPSFPALNNSGGSSFTTINMARVNNCCTNTTDNDETGSLFVQFTGQHKHFIMAHQTFPTAGLLIRSDIYNPLNTFEIDEFSRFVGNFFDSVSMTVPPSTGYDGSHGVPGVPARFKAQFRYNVIANGGYFGSLNLPANGFDNNVVLTNANTAATDLRGRDQVDFPTLAHGKGTGLDGSASAFAEADFTPKGIMRGVLFPAQLAVDIAGRSRAANDMAGGVGLAA